jgi:hypothetical protein
VRTDRGTPARSQRKPYSEPFATRADRQQVANMIDELVAEGEIRTSRGGEGCLQPKSSVAPPASDRNEPKSRRQHNPQKDPQKPNLTRGSGTLSARGLLGSSPRATRNLIAAATARSISTPSAVVTESGQPLSVSSCARRWSMARCTSGAGLAWR